MAGCAGDSGPGTPALVLLDSLADLDNGLVTSPVYIGPDLVVGAGMSPLSAHERHWVIRRDDSGRWAVTDEYEHRPAAVRFAAGGERRPGSTPTGPGMRPYGAAEDGGNGSSSGEPAGAVLAVLDGWGMVRPRLALVGGYWEPITTAEGFNRLAGDATGRRLFRAEDGDARHWSLLSPDPEADPAAVGLREVVTGTAAALPHGSDGSSQGWGLLSDQPGAEVALAQPGITGVLSPAELTLVPATPVPEEDPLGRTLLDSLAATVDGWSGSAPFLPSGMHRVPGPGGRQWVFVRASRPGARTCETELLEGWVRADRPDRLHQAVRGSTECGGPGWPASRPLGALQSGDRHFAISLEGEGPTARIGITELFETSVGSRRGGAAQLAEAPADEGAVPGAEGSADAWTAWPIVLSYIQPSALEGVPESIRNELESAGCLIPTLQWGRQNVVRGSFAAPGQEDWAVLCSRDGVSEIRLFWGGEARCPQPVAPSPDRQWLQDRGDSTAVLGRTVGRYTPDEVDRWLDYYELDPGIEFTHDVLLDTREGKPVTGFRYCSGGVWITEG
jgi:hypothetical protein